MSISCARAWVYPMAAISLGANIATAQDFPGKPIRIITTSAGGGNDFVARLIGPAISGSMGQPVIVDNRPPVNAAESVAKAPPDGYTLFVQGASLWIRALLVKMPYDPVRDFSPISLLVREVNIVVVHPSLPARSIRELITLAKARGGELNYSSPGTGTTQHLAMELFKSMAGANIVHIPSKGSPQAVTALLSGEVQTMIFEAGALVPHIRSGRLRALAVTSAEPSALVPGLPTVATTGLPGYEAVSLTGILAPSRTPDAIINRLNQEVVRVVNRPDVKEKLFNAGTETVGSTPEQFTATMKTEISVISKVIKDAGIKAE